MTMVLLDGVTADTTGDWVQVKRAGTWAVGVSGGLGGGTVKIQWSPDNGTTVYGVSSSVNSLTELSITSINTAAEPAARISPPAGHVRAVLSGSTSPTASVKLFETTPC